ncbi:uncharacterized protein LOC141599616 [Silene latifolia]|uniref:uncharacterized protein LOC141599616 n=1 Tax=Silene latifolia TaxID=37657 RepID=UPI003D7773A7
MGVRTLINLIRPLSSSIATLRPRNLFNPSSQILSNLIQSPKQQQQHYLIPRFHQIISRSIHLESLSSLAAKPFDPLTDTRFPKRRPALKSRRKRSSLRPKGPYAWVKHVEGEPIAPSQPNEGSVKLRNEKKRRRLHREFIKSERKKRKAELQLANQKKREKRIERKMAAVARDRDWACKLAELKRQEEAKKTAA